MTNMTRCTALASALLFLTAPCPAWQGGTALTVKASGTKKMYIHARAGNNQVTIFSESTIEDFTGVCNEVSGTCEIDPKSVESLKGSFSIRLDGLATGIELRDEHMRSPDWLDAAKYPEITIKIEKARDVKIVAPQSAKLTLVGTCSLHGVERKVEIPATITYLDESPKTLKRLPGDLMRIRASFEVKLSDYKVTGPVGGDAIGLKVSDTIRIRVSVFASTTPPPPKAGVDRGKDSGAGKLVIPPKPKARRP